MNSLYGTHSRVNDMPLFVMIRNALGNKGITRHSTGTWPHLVDLILAYVAWTDCRHTLVIRSVSRRYRDLPAVNVALSHVPARIAMNQTVSSGIHTRRTISQHDPETMIVTVDTFYEKSINLDHRRYLTPYADPLHVKQCIIATPRQTLTRVLNHSFKGECVQRTLCFSTHMCYYEWRGPGTITLFDTYSNMWYTLDFNYIAAITPYRCAMPTLDYTITLVNRDTYIDDTLHGRNRHKGCVLESSFDIYDAPVYTFK